MTVTTTTIKNSYSGNGSTVAFSYTFKVFASSELKVFVRTDSTGAESARTEGTGSANYAVSGVGETGGGTVTFVTAPASGETVVIRRETAQQQQTDYQPADPFPAESHESALDKLTHITQELQEEVDRSFKVSKTNTITTPEFVDSASARADLLLGFSSDGNELQATTGRVSSVTASAVATGESPTVSFNNATGALALGLPTGATGAAGAGVDTLTTRGDIIVQGASAASRLAVGAANRVIISDGTDPAYGQVPLATAVSGTLPAANGGTGVTSLTDGHILIGNGSTVTSGAFFSSSTGNLLASKGGTIGKHTIYVPAAAMRPESSNGCGAMTDVVTTSGRPDIQGLLFDGSSDEFGVFNIGLPKGWNEGVIQYRYFFAVTDAAATDGTDTVSFALQGVSVADDATIDVNYGTAVNVTQAISGTVEDIGVSAISGDVTIASAAENTLTFFRIGRDVSEDNMSEDCVLLGLQIFYTIDAGEDS